MAGKGSAAVQAGEDAEVESVSVVSGDEWYTPESAGRNLVQVRFEGDAFVALHGDDRFLVESAPQHGAIYGFDVKSVPAVEVDLKGRDEVTFGETALRVIHTPGHTPGHISIRALDNAFMVTGDAAVAEDGELAIANPAFCLDRAAAQRSLDLVAQYHCREYLCYHGGLVVR